MGRSKKAPGASSTQAAQGKPPKKQPPTPKQLNREEQLSVALDLRRDGHQVAHIARELALEPSDVTKLLREGYDRAHNSNDLRIHILRTLSNERYERLLVKLFTTFNDAKTPQGAINGIAKEIRSTLDSQRALLGLDVKDPLDLKPKHSGKVTINFVPRGQGRAGHTVIDVGSKGDGEDEDGDGLDSVQDGEVVG